MNLIFYMKFIKLLLLIIILFSFNYCKKTDTVVEPKKYYIKFYIKPDSLNFGYVSLDSLKISFIKIINDKVSVNDLVITINSLSNVFTVIGEKNYSIKINDTVLIPIGFKPNSFTEFNSSLELIHNSSIIKSPYIYKLKGIGDKVSNDVINFINEGWYYFKIKEFSLSRTKFDSAKFLVNIYGRPIEYAGEIQSGLGWANLMLKNFNDAIRNFNGSIAYSLNNQKLILDSNAGLAFAFFNLKYYQDAIKKCYYILQIDTNYIFSHMEKINFKRIRLCIIQSFYFLGDFTNAAKELDILDPLNAPHSSNPIILMKNIEEISNKL